MSESPENQHDPYDFGPISQRQAENLADFTIRRGESQQYEKLGRAVAKKVLYLVGTIGGALWVLVSEKGQHVVEVLTR